MHTSCKILKLSRYLRSTKTHMGKLFGICFFFLSKKTRLYRYYHNRNQLGVISSSYINLSMKLLIKSWSSPKKWQKWNLHFWESGISVLLQIGSLSFQASLCSKEWCRLTKNQNLNLWKIPNDGLKLPRKIDLIFKQL